MNILTVVAVAVAASSILLVLFIVISGDTKTLITFKNYCKLKKNS